MGRRLLHLPRAELVDFIELCLRTGVPREDALDAAAELLDAALRPAAVVPGEVGEVLEAVDGPLIRAALRLVWAATQRRLRPELLAAGGAP